MPFGFIRDALGFVDRGKDTVDRTRKTAGRVASNVGRIATNEARRATPEPIQKALLLRRALEGLGSRSDATPQSSSPTGLTGLFNQKVRQAAEVLAGAQQQQQQAQLADILGPAPAMGSYLAPYNQAEQLVRQRHAESLPFISSEYARLRENLTGSQQQTEAALNAEAAAAAAERVAAQQAVRDLQNQAAADVAAQFDGQVQGSTSQAFQEDQALQAANMQQQARLQQELERGLMQAEQSAHRDRIASSQQVETAARTQADRALDDALLRIGMGRAGAEEQFRRDSQQFKRDQLGLQQEQQMMDYEQGLARYNAQVENWANRYASNPVAMTATLDLVDGAGDGPGALTRALGLLHSKSDEEIIEQYGRNLDRKWIEQRIRERYAIKPPKEPTRVRR